MKKKTAKRPSKRSTRQKAHRTVGMVGSAIASTASFAAGVVRETEELIRDLASPITKGTDPGPSPGATDLLVHQHRRVEELFERLESPKKRFNQTLRELADDLSAHISIEEQLFYPAVRKVNPDLILEGLEEHAMGRFALERLLGTRATEKSLKARLKALKELMTNHHHEEERELFPAVRRKMSDAALRKLGAKMHALFAVNVKRGHEAVLASFDDTLRKPVRAKTPKRGKSAARV
ncbi:MAG TPA: hemerythrin domain-containing protein [Polyangiaceae bacterium]|nr:hemerythrin domain-containing protein [Polyangiaceae bacterium]